VDQQIFKHTHTDIYNRKSEILRVKIKYLLYDQEIVCGFSMIFSIQVFVIWYIQHIAFLYLYQFIIGKYYSSSVLHFRAGCKCIVKVIMFAQEYTI